MKILFTGASGFLGKIMWPILGEEHRLISIGRAGSNTLQVDLSQQVPQIADVDVVIHAAGKAHIYPKTESEKQEFYNVNVQGTENLLQGLVDNPIKAFVFISSVSVYGLEQGINIDENTPLMGKSPYALSKIRAEQLVENWCKEQGVDYLILRLPLIVGKQPLGNLKKMVDGIQGHRYWRIAKGDAHKSAVLADDVAHLIQTWLKGGKRTSGIYNLTDGIHPTFYELEEGLRRIFGVSRIPTMPGWLGALLGKIGDRVSLFPVNSGTIKKITCSFTFSDEKARREINWNPKPVLENLQVLKS
ncbi:MAG: NAD-dependent epimerase/dehydratase family protein [Chitinophagaceae bacterium]